MVVLVAVPLSVRSVHCESWPGSASPWNQRMSYPVSAGLPVPTGAVHVTRTLVDDVLVTVTPVGAPGGSFTSVTVMFTLWEASTVVSVAPARSLPSCTLTVIE